METVPARSARFSGVLTRQPRDFAPSISRVVMRIDFSRIAAIPTLLRISSPGGRRRAPDMRRPVQIAKGILARVNRAGFESKRLPMCNPSVSEGRNFARKSSRT